MSGISLTLYLDKAAQLYPDVVATRFRDRSRTWAEVSADAAALSGGLSAMGIGFSDRVAVMALNSDRYFALYYAVWRVGAALAPLNTRWSVSENRLVLADAEPKLLFIDRAFAAQAEALRQPGMAIAFMDDDGAPPGVRSWAEVSGFDAAKDFGASGGDMAGIFFTGGTTGRPKGAMLSHEGLAISLMASGLIAGGNEPPRLLTVLPLFHLSGAQQAIGAAMRGSTVRITEKFDVEQVLRLIQEEQITQLALVPAMWGMVLNHPNFERYDTSSLAAAMYGAAPMPEGTLRTAIKKLPASGFAQGYGQTETSGITTLLGPEDHDPDGAHPDRLRSCGKTLPFAQIKVADANGAELIRGEVGEIWVRGPHVMLGYWRRPAETASTLVDGWVRTGDAAYMDQEGYIFIVDRVKDMIISGGENVFSSEVETVLSLHPAVLECAVVGAPDPKWGERVVAIVRLRPGVALEPEDLISFCRARIAGYKCPEEVVVRQEPLPLSAAGKILKTALREPFWRGRARAVN